MKYLLILLLVVQSAFGSCDWSKIEKGKDGNFIYSPELHLCVGKLVEQDKLREEQVASLNKAITLKDLAVTKVEARAEMWRTTAFSLEDQMLSRQKYSVYRDWTFFGLGILAMGLSVWSAGHIYK